MHVEGFFHIFFFLCIVRTLLQNIIHDNGNKNDIPDDSCYWLQCICMTYMAQESVSLSIDKVSNVCVRSILYLVYFSAIVRRTGKGPKVYFYPSGRFLV